MEENILLADGFNEALIGTGERAGSLPVAVYDRQKCIDILCKQDMSREEAEEYFDFNVIGAYVGKQTPIFVTIGDTCL